VKPGCDSNSAKTSVAVAAKKSLVFIGAAIDAAE
jgi:hypothetical protein